MIYFDCAASAPADAETLAFLTSALQSGFANQEAGHRLAYELRQQLAEAAEQLAFALTGSGEWEVIWGTSATELFWLLAAALHGRSVLSSTLEHPALTEALQSECRLTLLSCDRRGQLPVEDQEEPHAVFIHQVQSELGSIPDAEKLFARFPHSLHLLDAVQAAGKLPWCSAADAAVVSGVKFGAPAGAAILVRKTSPHAETLLKTAADARVHHRISRVPAAICRTLAFAAARCAARRESEYARLSTLNARLRAGAAALELSPTLPDGAPASPYILNLFLPGKQAAVIVRALSEKGIHLASGSACAAEAGGPSPALLALGFRRADAYGALRISFGARSTMDEVEILLDELKTALKNY